MDKQLLDALDNLSFALDEIAKALNSKNGESQSSVGSALQSGDFSNQMVEIGKGIQSIKEDTKKILENQNTILNMQKEKDSKKTDVFEESGQKKNSIKDGVVSVLLIAGAVLAIGTAFSLLGDVDWKTVISLSISLPLLAMAFEKISTMKDLSYKNMINLFLITTTMSMAVLASSYILSGVKPVGASQLLTVVLIAASFSLISFNVGKLVTAFSSISTTDAIKSSFLMPLLLTSVSMAIAASSYFLDMVKPIGLSQAITSILIAGTFTVLGYGVGKLLESFKGISVNDAISASFLIPILLVSISYAISLSSSLLAGVTPIGLSQAITSILIAATFTVISYGVGQLLKGFNGISASDAMLASLTLPLLLVGISAAIVGSSYLIKNIQDVSMSQLITFFGIGLTLSVVGIIMGVALKVISKIGKPEEFFEGAISTVFIAGAIAISSHIIAMGNYTGNFPPLDWSIGVGLSLIIFSLPVWFLGKMGVSDIIKGTIAAVLVSGSIMVSSLILEMGSYKKYPSLDWALGVGLSLGAFGLAAVLLGAVALSPTFYMGLGAVLLVAGSIVATSYILESGSYKKYPSFEWASSVGLLMAGFSVGIIGLALASPFILVGSAAMLMLGGTILAIDKMFESGSFTKYPSEEWFGGVKKTILGFIDLMDVVSIGSAISGAVSDMFGGGLTDIAESILEIDKVFEGGNFTKYPSMAWGNGVLNAIAKFNQIKNALSGGSKLGDIFGGNDLQNTVSSISQLAVAFDRLGKAMSTFANSISSIDEEKLTAIKSLSSTVVLMSLLNPDQFSEMMDAMEEKSGIFGEFIDEYNNSRKEAETGGFFSSFKSPSSDKPKSDADILGPKLDKMNALLADISTVVGSKGSLKTYINNKGREANVSPTKK
jgi:hypothetical protein